MIQRHVECPLRRRQTPNHAETGQRRRGAPSLTRRRPLHKHLRAAPRGIDSLPRKHVRTATGGSAVALMGRAVEPTMMAQGCVL
jgi:hypothetical protein